MRVILPSAPLLVAAVVLAVGGSSAHGQSSGVGTHTGAHADVSPNGSVVPSPPGATADSALLTGALGTRSPSGAVVVAGTTVRLAWSGDEPGATRAWAVRRGTCSRDAGVLGAPGAYPPIRADARGSGTAEAVLPGPLSGSDTYFVAVHAGSVTAPSTLVACGPIRDAAAPASPGTGHEGMSHGTMPQGASSPGAAGSSPSAGAAGAAADHAAMGHGGAAQPAAAVAPRTIDGTANGIANGPSVADLHTRLMADPVIRQRVMADTAMHRMMMESMQRMPAGHGENMPSMTHGSSSAIPVQQDARASGAATRRAAPPARPTPRPAARPADPHARHESTPAARPAGPARTPARAPAKPAARDSMAGMDHSKHQMGHP